MSNSIRSQYVRSLVDNLIPVLDSLIDVPDNDEAVTALVVALSLEQIRDYFPTPLPVRLASNRFTFRTALRELVGQLDEQARVWVDEIGRRYGTDYDDMEFVGKVSGAILNTYAEPVYDKRVAAIFNAIQNIESFLTR